jgi:hypothetical protein
VFDCDLQLPSFPLGPLTYPKKKNPTIECHFGLKYSFERSKMSLIFEISALLVLLVVFISC